MCVCVCVCGGERERTDGEKKRFDGARTWVLSCLVTREGSLPSHCDAIMMKRSPPAFRVLINSASFEKWAINLSPHAHAHTSGFHVYQPVACLGGRVTKY
jgi:hypothetical protein